MTDDMIREDAPLTYLGRRHLENNLRLKDRRRISNPRHLAMAESPPKKPRTSEDFYLFCKFILEYEKYGMSDKEEPQDIGHNQNGSNGILNEMAHASDTDDSQGVGIMSSSDSYGSDDDTLSTLSLIDSDENEMDVDDDDIDYDENEDDGHDDDDDDEDEDENFDLVTCFCKKPFAGRPMIECSKCLTWIHLSCAKVKRSEIPDVFICLKCNDKE